MPVIPTIAAAAKQIAARQLSPVELAQACLARIKALDNTLHAFLLLTEERALADAKAAEARMMARHAAGQTRRHSDRPQGHLQHRRHPCDGALQAAGT